MKRVIRFAVAVTTTCLSALGLTTSAYAASSTPTTATQRLVVDSPYPGKLIQIKSKGVAVKAIQARLNQLGFNVKWVDGDFGPLTQTGVRRFQAAHHLVVDGIVGPQTWGALFQSSSKLLRSIQRYTSTRQSDVSVAVYNKQTNTTYVYNPYQRFDTASIVKPLILATLLHQNEVHKRKLTPLENQLAVPMIEQSNNNDATRLWNLVGRSKGVGTFTELTGMNSTTPNPYGYWGLTTTTALDQVHLVEDFAYPNRLMNTSDRNYGLNLMRHIVSWEHWGVSAGVPAKVSVALKNGWLPIGVRNWEINSIGYINGEGRNYVVGILSRNNPTEAYGIATTEGVSRLVWNQLTASK